VRPEAVAAVGTVRPSLRSAGVSRKKANGRTRAMRFKDLSTIKVTVYAVCVQAT
jgi:hypothetical protein